MLRRLIVIMGPSGCGKSRIGSALARQLDVPFVEGDDFHPPANRAKMASGHALGDNERTAWMDAIGERLDREGAQQVVLACSALTSYVQSRLIAFPGWEVCFILLQADRALLSRRMQQRSDHFMPVSLLDSQTEALQIPQDALIVDASKNAEAIVTRISEALDRKPQ